VFGGKGGLSWTVLLRVDRYVLYVDLLSWMMVVGIVHYSVIIIIIIATAAVCRERASYYVRVNALSNC